MNTFKAYFKVLNKCKVPIILYTVILIVFGGVNMQTSDTNTVFESTKPSILIVNEDENEGITKNLVKYISENSEVVDIKNTPDAINDALFYREINYIVYIREGYRKAVLNDEDPVVEVKSTANYQSSVAEMNLKRYLNLVNIYNDLYDDEDVLIAKINDTLDEKVDVEVTSLVDTAGLYNCKYYFNFLNYSMIAATIFVICLVLSTFNEEKIKRRMLISGCDYGKVNRTLLLCSLMFSIVLWLFYIIVAFIILGSILFSLHGLLFILNSFIFMLCCVTLSFLVNTIINNKNAINGVVNVLSLGTSFLCGAFVPVELLPKEVLSVAHILPSYYYINSNEVIASLEIIDKYTLKPVFINMGIIIGFSILFIIISSIITKRRRVK